MMHPPGDRDWWGEMMPPPTIVPERRYDEANRSIESEAVDTTQIAVALGVVHPPADDEIIRDVEPGIGDRQIEGARRGLSQQRAERDPGRSVLAQGSQNGRAGPPGVEDVL